MTSYDDILIATDGEPVAETATQYALTLASEFDATAHVLSVVRTEVAGNYLNSYLSDETTLRLLIASYFLVGAFVIVRVMIL